MGAAYQIVFRPIRSNSTAWSVSVRLRIHGAKGLVSAYACVHDISVATLAAQRLG